MVIDVGTNNADLRADPLYAGLRAPRITGPEYFAVIDEVRPDKMCDKLCRILADRGKKDERDEDWPGMTAGVDPAAGADGPLPLHRLARPPHALPPILSPQFVTAAMSRWPRAVLQFEDFSILHVRRRGAAPDPLHGWVAVALSAQLVAKGDDWSSHSLLPLCACASPGCRTLRVVACAFRLSPAQPTRISPLRFQLLHPKCPYCLLPTHPTTRPSGQGAAGALPPPPPGVQR